MMPRLSSYQPGLVEPKPALPDQLVAFSAIGIGAAAADPAIASISAPGASSSADQRRRSSRPPCITAVISLRMNIAPPNEIGYLRKGRHGLRHRPIRSGGVGGSRISGTRSGHLAHGSAAVDVAEPSRR